MRGERHADQQLEPFARRLDEGVELDVGRDFVRRGAKRNRARERSRRARAARRRQQRDQIYEDARDSISPTAYVRRTSSRLTSPIAFAYNRHKQERTLRTTSCHDSDASCYVGEATMINHRSTSASSSRACALALASSRSASARRVLQQQAEAQGSSVTAPMFEVDPLWPKPLPNHWLLGWTIGVWVDEQDHVWIIHRGSGGLHNNERGAELNPPLGECCRAAPPVLVFDPAGNLVRSWGGPGQGYEWPQSNHGIHVDYKGNVWIGGNGAKDAHILKFTKDGKFLMQVGSVRQERRQQRSGELRPRREDLGRSEDQRGLRRRRLSQQARRGARRRHRQDEALLGRLRQQAGRRQPRPLRSGGAAGAAVPQPGALRRAVERRARLRLRPRATTASRCSRRTASS